MKSRWYSIIMAAVLVVGLALITAPQRALAAACTFTSNSTGNWSTGGTWTKVGTSCGTYPGSSFAGDVVVISSGHTVTLDVSPTNSTQSVTINSGGVLTITRAGNSTGWIVIVAGDVVINGTLQVVNGSNPKNHSLQIGGNLTNNGTFTAIGYGIPTPDDFLDVTMNGAVAQTIDGASSTTFHLLTINNGNGVTLSQDAAVETTNPAGTPGSLILTNGNLTTGSNDLVLNGTVTCGSNMISGSAGGTVNYSYYNGNQNVCAGTYGNLTTSVTSGTTTRTRNLAGAVTVLGNVTVGQYTTLVTNNYNMTVAGNWTNNGAFTAGTGTVTFNGTATQTVGGSQRTSYNNLVIAADAVVSSSYTTGSAPYEPRGTSITNYGFLQQATSVGASSTTAFNTFRNPGDTADTYYGATIVTDGSTSLGNTTVSVGGEQSKCNDWTWTTGVVQRCFNIHPTNGGSPTVTFYYQASELNGATAGSLYVWKYNSSDGKWYRSLELPAQSASCSTAGTLNCFVTVQLESFGALNAGADNWYVLGGASGAPTAVTLAEFAAAQANDAIVVTWQTASELDNRGFNLWRGTSEAGPDLKLNETLIPSQSQGLPGSGFEYTWEDRADLVPGATYWYWLEDLDVNGVLTRHDPISVAYVTPTAVGLAAFGGVASVAGPALGGLAVLALAALGGVAARRRR